MTYREEEQARYARLYARLHAPPEPPLDAARKFLHSFFADYSWDEAGEHIAKLAAVNPRLPLAGLAGKKA